MLTTLTQRLLTSATVSYKFFNRKIHIYIDTPADHEVFGDVNITLANVLAITLYTDSVTKIDDYFNGDKIFTATTKRRLEFTQDILNGLPASAAEVSLPNNGGAITATVDNLSIEYAKGTYLTRLIDDSASVFDGALVTVQERGIVNVEDSFDGLIDSFDEVTGATYQTIDNQTLTFGYSFELGVSTPGASTNIPLSLTRI